MESFLNGVKSLTLHLVLPGTRSSEQEDVQDLILGQFVGNCKGRQCWKLFVVHTNEVLVIVADLHVRRLAHVTTHRAFDSSKNLSGKVVA